MRKVILKTYSKLWNMPFKIYSIDNLKLIVPVKPWEALVFIVCLLFMVLISSIMSFINIPISIPWIVKYVLLPYGLMKLVENLKLDGKKPYKFLFDLFIFLLKPKRYERFKPFKLDDLKGLKETFLIKKEVLDNESFSNKILWRQLDFQHK